MPDLSSAQTKYLSRLKREKYFVNISRLVLFAGFLALWEVSAGSTLLFSAVLLP